MHRLSEDDVSTYRSDGFLVLRNLLSRSELDHVERAVSELLQRGARLTHSTNDFNLEAPSGGFANQANGMPGYAGVLRAVFFVERHSQYLSALPTTNGFSTELAGRLLGEHCAFKSSVLWCKAARVGSEQPWHQDYAYVSEAYRREHPAGMTVWIAVDRANRSNGCLFVARGSQRLGLLPHVGNADPAGDDQLRVANPSMLDLEPGDAVAFDVWTAHGSAPNRSENSRRAISWAYVSREVGHP
jgi:2-oxoglutarate-dependent dioxygenase